MARKVRIVVEATIDEGSMYLRNGAVREELLKDHALYVVSRDTKTSSATVEDLGEEDASSE